MRPALPLALAAAAALAACVAEVVPFPLSPGLTAAPTDGGAPVVVAADGAIRQADACAAAPGADAGAVAGPDAQAPLPGLDAEAVGPCPASLADRLKVASVDVAPAQVDVGSGYGWANNFMVVMQPLSNGLAKVAWSGGGQAHVTPLRADLTRAGADLTLAADKVRGFVAHDDGAVALLVVRGDSMFLLRFDASGQKQFETSVVGPLSSGRWVDSWGDQSRLVWDGTHYWAYYGHTQDWGAQGKHQGDTLSSYDVLGAASGGLWDWGCSHSLDLRMIQFEQTLYPVCLSDCYPQKAICANHNSILQMEPSGGCNGYSDATLGGLAGVAGQGAMVTFTSKEGRAADAGGVVRSDVGLVSFDKSGANPTVKWLTSTPDVEESSSHLARYGTDFLAEWEVAGQTRIARIRADGSVVEGPADVAAHIEQKDDFVTFADGDVGWAWGAGQNLQVARVRSCP
jgi:hypothetical protein